MTSNEERRQGQSLFAAPHHAASGEIGPLRQLTKQVVSIAPRQRGAALRSALSFHPDSCLDGSIYVGALRASFANWWEAQFQEPVPILALRQSMQAPLPIGLVLHFNKLNLTTGEAEVENILRELGNYLFAETRPSPIQLKLYENGQPIADEEDTDNDEIGRTVTNLDPLIQQGRKFATIYADPPWRYSNQASHGAAENHYPTLSVREICEEPVQQVAADNAHLHLWTTSAFLREAFDVIGAWGFRYKSSFVWVKPDIGTGNYWRLSHELLLLGVRGKLTFIDRTQRSWIKAARTVHSRKPGIVRTLIEKVSPGPYLEMYGREELHDSAWTVYGNQVERRLF